MYNNSVTLAPSLRSWPRIGTRSKGYKSYDPDQVAILLTLGNTNFTAVLPGKASHGSQTIHASSVFNNTIDILNF